MKTWTWFGVGCVGFVVSLGGCGDETGTNGTGASGGSGGGGSGGGSGTSGGLDGSGGTGNAGGSGGSTGTGGAAGTGVTCPIDAGDGILSLARFEAAPRTLQAPWASGGQVTIDGRNGDIVVRAGDSGVVRATFSPFVYRACNTPAQEVYADFAPLVTSADANAGGVMVMTDRLPDARSTLGADIDVFLPPDFNGDLQVLQQNGSTYVQFAGAATSLLLTSDNGTCQAHTGTSASNVSVSCSNGDLTATLGGVPPGAMGGSFAAGLGSILLTLPRGPRFSVAAQALAGGTVDTGTAEASGCTVQIASDASKTVSCNGATSADPVYTVTADGTALSEVRLGF